MSGRNMIPNAISYGYEFKISDYISRGFKIFKDNPGGFIGFVILFFIISIVIQMIPLLGFLIAIIVSPPLSVGIAIASHKQENDGDMAFGNFFKGFDYIGQLIVAKIIMLVIYFIIAIPLIFMVGIELITSFASGDPEAIIESGQEFAKMGIWFLVFAMVFTYLAVCLRWTNYLIVFHKYEAVSAIKTSWQLVNKRWIWHFLFLLLCGLIMLAGFIALLVGIVVAYPIIMAADYAGYADITGLNQDNDDINELGTDVDLV
ncbi:MAG: hypothetical protein IPJ13_15815 [Saprospiraceae bacterium]|jgi:membrane-anchored glycerophosphoryl diester phosphodiesterase (GDPDase)|nr:hypothetical protein [Saprospiraceae bacterium]MBP6446169.1 hypothetical protein [Saprospiraceae bacterium]